MTDDGTVEVPEQLTLRVGQSTSFRLPGLGTAGYQWTAHIGADVIGVRWQRGLGAGEVPAAVGVSAPETVTLTGLRAGTTTVELVQARPWEPAEAALDRRCITVTVAR